MTTSRSGRSLARHVLATHDTHAQASATVAYLETAGVYLDEVTVAGSDLRLVQDPELEPRLQRLASLGAAGGAWAGLVVGVLVALLAQTDRRDSAVVLLCLIGGALVGAAVAGTAELVAREHRRPQPGRLVATRFDVVVPEEQLAECQQAMGSMTRRGAV